MTTTNGASVVELAHLAAESKAKQPAPEPQRPELGPDAYHGLAGEVVAVLEPHTEAHPAALLLQLLAAFGNAVGTTPYMVADAARHHARLFVAVVGRSALGRKGTAWSNVAAILEHADERWATDRIISGLASGEGLIAAVSDSGEEDAPPTDKRLLVREGEFARALAVASRDGTTLSAILRDAFDSGNLAVHTRRDALKARGAHISVVGHITPDELRAKLTDLDAANGLGNRFLFAMVERTKRLPFGGDLDDRDYRDLGLKLRLALDNARRIGRVKFSADGRKRWAELYDLMDRQARHSSGMVESMTSRADAQTLRLALIYALLDGSAEVTTAHLDAAWAVWEFSRESVEFLFGSRTGLTIGDRVLDAIHATGGTCTRSDLYKAMSGHLRADNLDAVLDVLVRDERVVSYSEPTGGRPRAMLTLPGQSVSNL